HALLTHTGNYSTSLPYALPILIVVDQPIFTTQPTATQTLCTGGTPTNLTVAASGGTGSFTYQWYSNAANSNTGGTSISGATNARYRKRTGMTCREYKYAEVIQR